MKTVLRIGAAVCLAAGAGMLVMWNQSALAPAKLQVESVWIRKALMTFAYQVYAKPDVADGRYFLSKVVFKNSGGQPVRDLSISYQVPDHISWNTPDVTPLLPAGNTLVKTIYPNFGPKIAQLHNRTTARLEIKLQWREEEGGPLKEEIHTGDFDLRGVNDLIYSDMPAEEMASWYDQWNLAQFMVCMVTPNDPYVKEYAAAITQRMGGDLASVSQDPNAVLQLMRATYDYMVETGMNYAGAKGVPEKIGDDTKLVQVVKLPRDVIIGNNGLCIELAILWASIMDHLGCNSYIVLRPGHAFTVVEVGGNQFPIECTAITPKAVGSAGYVSFEQAMQIARDDLAKQEFKIPFNVQTLQGEGYTPPELGAIDVDRIKNILAERSRGRPPPQTVVVNQPQQPGQMPTPGGQFTQPTAPAGMARYDHRAGLVSFAYPQTWQMQQAVAQIGNTFAVGDATTSVGVQVYEVPNTNDPSAAMNMIAQAIGQFGSQVMVQDTRVQGNVTVIQGMTLGAGGQFQWQGVFRAVPGGVIGIVAGAPSQLFEANRASFNQILGTVQFK
jgi:hypothetical protein